jgi:hypothetical protein
MFSGRRFVTNSRKNLKLLTGRQVSEGGGGTESVSVVHLLVYQKLTDALLLGE